MLGLINEV
jgi:hypothetical protein